LRFHEIGRLQDEDEVVYEDRERPGYTFKASVSQGDQFVFLEVYDKGRGSQVWAAKVDAKEGSNVNGSQGHSLNLRFESKVSGEFDMEWEYDFHHLHAPRLEH